MRVNGGAGDGQSGVWLLDPSQIDIVASGATDQPEFGGVFSYGGDVGTVLAGDINTALGFYGSVVIHTDGAGIGNGNITANNVSISGAGSLTLAAYGGGGATGNIEIGGSTVNVNGGFKVLAGWNGATSYMGSDVIPGTGDIWIYASQIQSNANIDLHAGHDIMLGTDLSNGPGTGIQAQGFMSVSAGHDLKLLGGSGSISDISAMQGSGVMLSAPAGQDITAENGILRQEGSAKNTAYGGSVLYGVP